MKVNLGKDEDYPVLFWEEVESGEFESPDDLWMEFKEAEGRYHKLHDKIFETCGFGSRLR